MWNSVMQSSVRSMTTDEDEDLPDDDDDSNLMIFSLTDIDGIDENSLDNDDRNNNTKSGNKNNQSYQNGGKSFGAGSGISGGFQSGGLKSSNFQSGSFQSGGIKNNQIYQNGCKSIGAGSGLSGSFQPGRIIQNYGNNSPRNGFDIPIRGNSCQGSGDGSHGDSENKFGCYGDSNHGSGDSTRPSRWASAKPVPLRLNLGLQNQVAHSLDSHRVFGTGGHHGSSVGGDGGAFSSSPKLNWMHAVKKVRHIKDTWEKYRLNDLPIETAIRHRYHALKRQWFTDKVEVKMEKESFDEGAMRCCYRLKKLPSATHTLHGAARDWKHAHNYVAKRYMTEGVGREVYFTDVKMQLDAKLWGEEYSRHNPPKKVDIVQMAVLEFEDRPEGSRFYHLENYIEGHYTKYNSNSGFVDQNTRSTPQAFSHFTFERSGHQLIVVDIQGVGDLWTDPQIHTAEGTDYGDGNLGTKGMALFFHSHVCNSICESLGLSKFDLAASESPSSKEKSLRLKCPTTRVRGDEEMCIAASPLERTNLHQFLERERVRRQSTCSSLVLSEEEESPTMGGAEDLGVGPCEEVSPRVVDELDCSSPMLSSPRIRNRYWSESDDSGLSSTRSEEEERMRFQLASSNVARPACVENELNLRNINNLRCTTDSVLGQIHHDLAKYHEMGRFTERGADTDMSAALYHEQYAADLGIKEAMVTLASIYFSLPHEILVSVSLEKSEENMRKGMEYMEMAAEAGDRGAMLYLARAYETGLGLSSDRARSYRDAVEWYQSAACMSVVDVCGEYDGTMDNPLYELKAKIAELYLEGGHGLEKDASYAGELYTEAAESATAAMKGRIANKFYALAEEAWAQVE